MSVADKLAEVAADFVDLDPRERLELLLEFAEGLPPLPERYRAERDAGLHRIQECQTPVFVWVERQDEQVRLFADVAPEAPTVKGFVAILVEAFNGATPDDILSTGENLVNRLGLLEALGMQRMRGLRAIEFYLRKQIERLR